MKIMGAVKNNCCQILSCSVVNAIDIIVSFLNWELHITSVVLLTVNPSIYVELTTLYISEWLAAFNFVLSSYFVVSFDKAVETLTQFWCKMQQNYIMQCWFRTNVLFVI
jgi:hypothetical protein